ncbi:hypothetical protein [uncultured Leifsonia sp.]|uniref:hypothetical protein n=1 Tax=uncultured Leifsonia sp. TaxID=340359 RepID=UPI0025FECEE7|nr:hypothetical protein [uncultured Leifsonia sp.]
MIEATTERTRRGARRLDYLTRATHAEITPERLLGSLSREQWLVMSDRERADHLFERLLKENLSTERDRKARRLARRREERGVTPAESAVAPDASAVASEIMPPTASWFVACACGCGEWLTARSHRPAIAYASGHRAKQKRSAATR